MKQSIDMEIVDLLSNKAPYGEQIGFAVLGNHPEYYAAEIMEAFTRITNTSRSMLAAFCKSRFPFFSDPYITTKNLNTKKYSVGSRAHKQEAVFLNGVEKWLSFKSDEDIEFCLRLLANQKALHSEYGRIIQARWGEEGLELFRSVIRSHTEPLERQLGFVPTYRCNLDCEYCMSTGLPQKDADIEDIRWLISWASRMGVRRLSLYGGEPTYYPGFVNLLSEIQKAGLKVYFPSNLIASKEAINAVKPDLVEKVFVHIPSSRAQHVKIKTLKENALRLRNAGVEILIRYNLMEEDWSFILEYACFLNLDKISFAPVVEHHAALSWDRNKWLQYAGLSDRFARFILDNGLKPVLAKPQPLCCVEEVSNLPLWNVFSGNCAVHLDDYTFCIMIRPDLKVGLCCADHVEERPSLRKFTSWKNLQSYAKPLTSAWQESPLWQTCRDCYYRVRALCQGACLFAKPQPLSENIEICGKIGKE
ncbi:MAG: radical SAM protein [Candidatus Aminicenantaceae bacterium]